MKEDFSLERETTLHLADHEILLSFNNDRGAELFEEWMYNGGIKAFDEYCGKGSNFE